MTSKIQVLALDYRNELKAYNDVERLTVLLASAKEALLTVSAVSTAAKLEDIKSPFYPQAPFYPKEMLDTVIARNADLKTEVFNLSDFCIRYADARKKLASIKTQEFENPLLAAVAKKRATTLALVEAKIMAIDSCSKLKEIENELKLLHDHDRCLSVIFESPVPSDLSLEVSELTDVDKLGVMVSTLEKLHKSYTKDWRRISKIYEERCKQQFDKPKLNSSLTAITLKRLKILASP